MKRKKPPTTLSRNRGQGVEDAASANQADLSRLTRASGVSRLGAGLEDLP